MHSKKAPILHPFLIGLYPILFLYDQNKKEIPLAEALFPIVFTLALATILLFLAKTVYNNKNQSGILVSLLLILFFSYGHIFHIVSGFKLGGILIGRDRYLLLAYGISIVIIAGWLKRSRGNFSAFTMFLNFLSCALCFFSLISIGVFKANQTTTLSVGSPDSEINQAPDFVSQSPLPDIYFFVLDQYAREDILKEFFGYDNSEFIQYLKSKGFFVAQKSRANFIPTPHSLSASLNMEYINYVGETLGKESRDLTPLYQKIENNKVMRFLKSNGYRYYHFSSGWIGTAINKNADKNVILLTSFNAFTDYLIDSTLIKPITAYFFGLNYKHRKRVLYSFKKLAEMPQEKGPKFVFAHMMIPHMPYVFDQDGRDPHFKMDVSNVAKNDQRRERLYLGQLIYVSKRIKELFNILLSQSKTPPIIILQSDTGHVSLQEYEGYLEAARNEGHISESFLRQYISNLNASYLPGGCQEKLYESITPVNTFRLIFDCYFGTQLGLLPDKSFLANYEVPYKFIAVPIESGK